MSVYSSTVFLVSRVKNKDICRQHGIFLSDSTVCLLFTFILKLEMQTKGRNKHKNKEGNDIKLNFDTDVSRYKLIEK